MVRFAGVFLSAILASLVAGAAPLCAQTPPQASALASAQASTSEQVNAAIRNAAHATGVEYEYLAAKAQIESRLDPDARAKSSSAAGLFQFIESTWLQGVVLYGARYGLEHDPRLSSAKNSGRGTLALRLDPQLSALMAAAYTKGHADRLRRLLGRDATHAELYLAHFLGSGGAAKFLRAWRADRHQAAHILFPKAARANRSIFFTRSGTARSLDQMLTLIEGKIEQATIHAQNQLDSSSPEYKKYKIPAFLQQPKGPSAEDVESVTGAQPRPKLTPELASHKTQIFLLNHNFIDSLSESFEPYRTALPATAPPRPATSPGSVANPDQGDGRAANLQSHRNVLPQLNEHINNHTSSRSDRDGRVYKSRNCARSRPPCQHIA